MHLPYATTFSAVSVYVIAMNETLQKKRRTEKVSLNVASVIRQSQHKKEVDRKNIDHSLIQLQVDDSGSRYVFNENLLPDTLKRPKNLQRGSLQNVRRTLEASEDERYSTRKRLAAIPKISLMNANSAATNAPGNNYSRYYKLNVQSSSSSESLGGESNQGGDIEVPAEDRALIDGDTFNRKSPLQILTTKSIKNGEGCARRKLGALGKHASAASDNEGNRTSQLGQVKAMLVGRAPLVRELHAKAHAKAVETKPCLEPTTPVERDEASVLENVASEIKNTKATAFLRVLSSNSLLFDKLESSVPHLESAPLRLFSPCREQDDSSDKLTPAAKDGGAEEEGCSLGFQTQEEVEGLAERYAIKNELYLKKIQADLGFGYDFNLSQVKVHNEEIEPLLFHPKFEQPPPPTVEERVYSKAATPSASKRSTQTIATIAPKSEDGYIAPNCGTLMPVQELDDVDDVSAVVEAVEHPGGSSATCAQPKTKTVVLKSNSVHWNKDTKVNFYSEPEVCGQEPGDAALQEDSRVEQAGLGTTRRPYESIRLDVLRKMLQKRKFNRRRLSEKLSGHKEKRPYLPIFFGLINEVEHATTKGEESKVPLDSTQRSTITSVHPDTLISDADDVRRPPSVKPLLQDETHCRGGVKNLADSSAGELLKVRGNRLLEDNSNLTSTNIDQDHQTARPLQRKSGRRRRSQGFWSKSTYAAPNLARTIDSAKIWVQNLKEESGLDLDEFLERYKSAKELSEKRIVSRAKLPKSNYSAISDGGARFANDNILPSCQGFESFKAGPPNCVDDSVLDESVNQAESEEDDQFDGDSKSSFNLEALILLQTAKQRDVLSMLDKSVLSQMKSKSYSAASKNLSTLVEASPKKKVQKLQTLLQKTGGTSSAKAQSNCNSTQQEDSRVGNGETIIGEANSDIEQQSTSLLVKIFSELPFKELLNQSLTHFPSWVAILSLANVPDGSTQDSVSVASIPLAERVGASTNPSPELCSANAVESALRSEEMTPSAAETLVESALQFIREGNCDRALVKLTLAIQSESTLKLAYWLRLQLFLLKNNFDAAEADIEKLTSMVRTNPALYWIKARLLEIQNKVKPAISSYTAVTRLAPDKVGAFFRRALLYEREGDKLAANDDLRNVRVLEPNNTYAIANEADHCFQRTLWEDAIVSYTRLLKLEPDNAHAFSNRGRAFAHLQRFEDALRDLNLAIGYAVQFNSNKGTITSVDNVSLAEYYYHRGSLTKLRNSKHALEDLSTALMLIRDSPALAARVYKQRASLYLAKGNVANALLDYQSASQLDPYDPGALASLGDIYRQQLQDFKKALEAYDNCVRIYPTDVQVLMKRASVHEKLHQFAKCDATGSEFTGLAGSRVALPPYLDFMEEARELEREEVVSGKRQQTKSTGDSRPLKQRVKNHLNLAIRDYSIVIHLCPNNDSVYLHRGRLLLQKNLLAESSHDFSSAFAINGAMAVTFSQKALVLLFQQKYEQIVDDFQCELAGTSITDETVWKLLAKAYSRLGNYAGALQALKQAALLKPNDSSIYLQMGLCHYRLGNASQAQEDLNKSLKLKPNFAKALYYRGLYRLSERHGERYGILDINKAIKIDPLFFDGYITRAVYQYKKGKYLEAIQDCYTALQLEPSSIRALLLRGCSYFRLKDYEAAVSNCTRALHVNPASYESIFNRAIAHTYLGNYWKAIADYSTALWCKPDINAFLNRGLIYWKLGDYANATTDFRLARDCDPSNIQMETLLGMCLLKINRVKESAAAFARAISHVPLAKEAYLGRSMTFLASGDKVNAVKDLEKVIHYYPLDVSAYVSLLHICEAESSFSYAYKLITGVIEWTSNKAHAFEKRAILLYKMKKFPEAMADIDRAIHHEKSSWSRNCDTVNGAESETAALASPVQLKALADYHINAGVISESLDDLGNAMNFYKSALKLDPSSMPASCNIATLYIRQRMFGKAISVLNMALSKSLLKDRAAYLLRSCAYALLGNIDCALQDLNEAISLDERDTIARFNRATIYQSLKRFDMAKEDYSAVLQRDPNDQQSLFKKGQCQLYCEEESEAFQTWRALQI